MPDVMNQCSCKRYLSLSITELAGRVRINVPPDYAHQRTGHVEHADAMREARVGRTREYELGEAQLSNAAQSLERRCLNHPPERVLELIDAEFDQIMYRIANALGLQDGH